MKSNCSRGMSWQEAKDISDMLKYSTQISTEMQNRGGGEAEGKMAQPPAATWQSTLSSTGSFSLETEDEFRPPGTLCRHSHRQDAQRL